VNSAHISSREHNLVNKCKGCYQGNNGLWINTLQNDRETEILFFLQEQQAQNITTFETRSNKSKITF
jgi:hypothetical protein